MDNKTNKSEKINVAIVIAIIGLVGGIIGSIITSTYQDKESKRTISLETIGFLSNDFLKMKSILLRQDTTKEQLNILFQHKETAFLAREMTRHLSLNYKHIDFRVLQSALTSIERRYSYARIYEKAELADVICENIVLNDKRKSIQLNPKMAKCESSDMDGVILTLLAFNHENNRFKLSVSNDKKGTICKNKNNQCKFWIDLGDRLESTPYEYLILAEYIGYEDAYNEEIPMVSFSIIHRRNDVINHTDDAIVQSDTSYWGYQLPTPLLTENNKEKQECEPFFDNDNATLAKPTHPVLEPFGAALLKACGPIRGQVSETEFEALMIDYWDTLKPRFPSSWSSLDDQKIKALLKRIWLSFNGFNHVFCGEWGDNGSIGGLHYRGRYLQLQEENTACYEKSLENEEIVEGSIYTIGVRSRDNSNTHAKKGYALSQSATDLFFLGLDAFEHCQTMNAGWKPYGTTFDNIFLQVVPDEQIDITYRVICKATDPMDKQSYGLLTIYPDATP